MKEQLYTLEVPVICTRGFVCFPNNESTIDVAREMSLKAIAQSRELYDAHIFVVTQKEIEVGVPTFDDLFNFGTFAQITNIRKGAEHTRLTLLGLERAKVLEYTMHDNVMFAKIEWVSDVAGDITEESLLIEKLTRELAQLKQSVPIPQEITNQLEKGTTAGQFTDSFGQYFNLSYLSRQKILETANVNDRLMLVLSYIEGEKLRRDIEIELNRKIKERSEDNQKEYYLREKLRIIKEELGDVSNVSDDAEEIRNTIFSNPYPENIKNKALEELARLEMLPTGSGESGVIRTYIDWLLKTPWYQESDDNNDLDLAADILDGDHYGLEKVKERILEYLAVKQMTNSLKSPIICLVGPPGVGKTSLAKSIAKALDRKFVKASLGGVKDESEIRGHRRTYLGSMPGRIIQGMKKAGVVNPVFLIDEIDKMASDYKGDPSSAMLEVLDPEQNEFFSDHYLEEPYNLSKVMFIATANYIENIPPALKDRLEVISLSSYTEVEKLHIAKNHLITKQVLNTGLKPAQFKLGDAEISYIIRHYTKESGVRQLERIMGTLTRKTALVILREKVKSVKVTKKLINEWLGKEIFDFGSKEKKDQVGVVTGLAYTSYGGDVLPVEVTFFEGKGKLIVTGQLGDVMKESTEIALDYIKSNAQKLKINMEFFAKNDIHIHVPEGAIPKDGPSAGITLTTALVSAITDTKVNKDVAMTGEVTLRGNVLPIGGLKEKSLAAHRSGIKTIIFPKGNVKDLDDVPSIVKESIEFIPVSSVNEVLAKALV